MYRIAFIFQFLIPVLFLAEAKKIPVETAVKVASQFCRELNDPSAPRSSFEAPVTLVHAANAGDEAALLPGTATDTCYYVFDMAGEAGFVILSGDDRTRPVLGYSMQGRFDAGSLPSNLAAWLNHYRDEITSIINQNPPLPPDPQWKRMESGIPPVKPRSTAVLYTASWNQDDPYNLQCPVLREGRALTGCVATSMAIVMKYHADRGYRAEGKGRHSYVDDGEEYAADFGAYDWANMPDRTEDFTSTVQRQAVARLMHHCAVSIESDFEVDGTGSINWRTSVALTSFFGYDGKLGYILKEEYSDAEWKKMIRNEIDADRPVIYDGDQKHGGGHSFVLSGYSDADLYFFNWGWGGRSNGWYALSALTPSIYDFSYGQGMLTGIQEASGEPISSLRLVKGRQSQTNPDGIVITEEGSRFIIHGGTFENRSYQPFFGSIGVALTDAGGAIREIVGSNDNCMLDGNHYRNNSRYIGDLYCTMTVAAAATDHLRFVSSEDNRQTWQTIYGAPGIAWETSVANEAIDPSPSVRVTGTVEGLRVNSPYSETLRVYSPEGRMLFEGFKQAGERRFDVRLPGGIVIVRSDHWVRKIINN